MKILIIGGGGREHALAWKLAQSPRVSQLFATPGNPGIAKLGGCIPEGDPLAIAQSVDADLTIVGPEAPLVDGIVNRFRTAGRKIVGPAAEAARLEGSKIFAKSFLRQSKIPTAEFVSAENATDARHALERFGYPVVIKADGLAGGKGVVVAEDRRSAEEALAALRPPLVVEQWLAGEEVSFIAYSDGNKILPFEPTQDHKRLLDGDRGPNTGGMGAYCDSGILTAKQSAQIMDTIVRPTVEATGFTGFLYAGLMMTGEGPKVLEFNVRLGDPETQPLLHRMDCDLVGVLLGEEDLRWKPGPSLCVVLVSEGYPGPYATGRPITGIEDAERAGGTVFHAGTRMGDAGLETAGGRVLGVTAGGADVSEAMEKAYAAASHIRFQGMHYRSDIGRRYNNLYRARSSDG